MKNSNFSVQIFANSELRMQLPFNFGGDYTPETKSEVIGTISRKFMRFMQMNKKWQVRNEGKTQPKILSSDALTIVFTFNGQTINTDALTSLFGAKFCFRMNKTIEKKFEHFLNDAIDLCMIDEIVDAQYICV
jgi:hypothetical protein